MLLFTVITDFLLSTSPLADYCCMSEDTVTNFSSFSSLDMLLSKNECKSFRAISFLPTCEFWIFKNQVFGKKLLPIFFLAWEKWNIIIKLKCLNDILQIYFHKIKFTKKSLYRTISKHIVISNKGAEV